MSGDHLENIVRNVFCNFPVLVIPVLKLCYFLITLYLNVQLNVLVQSRVSKIARSHQCFGPYDLQLCVSYICLCMKLIPVIDAAFNLALFKPLNDSFGPIEEWILSLFRFDTII